MSFKRFATFQVTSAVLVPESTSKRGLRAIAKRHEFKYEPRPGYLYVRSRAISSRTNDNYDEFPAEEIKKAYASFVGKPVFVNHVNDNHKRARGVIIDAALHEDRLHDGSPDTWVEVLMEVDAKRFPKLAKAIIAKRIDRTSMGCDVAYSVCSACGNKASTPSEYCAHIPRLKGKKILRANSATGAKETHLIRETCYGLGFFENSLLVEEPADPTAHFLGVDDHSGLTLAASRKTAAYERPLYHGTDEDSAQKIETNGFGGSEFPHGTYMSPDPSTAKMFAQNSAGCYQWADEQMDGYPDPDDCPHEDHEPPVVLKVPGLKGEGSPDDHVERKPDPGHTHIDAGDYVKSFERIDPKQISRHSSLTQHFASSADQWHECGQGHTHWGAAGAAGVLIRHTDDAGEKHYLLQHRAPWVQEGGTFGIPAGALRHGEKPHDGAMRESAEEIEGLPGGLTHAGTHTDDHGGWAFHTVVLDSPTKFDTKSSGYDDDGMGDETGEHGVGWYTAHQMKSMPLHSGFAKTFHSTLSKQASLLQHFAAADPYNHTHLGAPGQPCADCGEDEASHPHPSAGDWARCSTCRKDMSHHIHEQGRYDHLLSKRSEMPMSDAQKAEHVKNLYMEHGSPYYNADEQGLADQLKDLGGEHAEWALDRQEGKPTKFSLLQHFARAKVDAPSVSGVVLKAADTGRILMLQRGLDDAKDPAAGTWEFPGGHHEDEDHTSLHAAIREWEEEVGQPFPKGGTVSHTWRSPNGIYQGHVVVIPEEKMVALHDGRVKVNPDDPDGDASEQAAWWDPKHAKDNPALRREVKKAPWDHISKASNRLGEVAQAAQRYADNLPRCTGCGEAYQSDQPEGNLHDHWTAKEGAKHRNESVQHIALDKILPSDYRSWQDAEQPFTTTAHQQRLRMAQDELARGEVRPSRVASQGDGTYRLKDGHHRWVAHSLAGYGTMPCVVEGGSKEGAKHHHRSHHHHVHKHHHPAYHPASGWRGGYGGVGLFGGVHGYCCSGSGCAGLGTVEGGGDMSGSVGGGGDGGGAEGSRHTAESIPISDDDREFYNQVANHSQHRMDQWQHAEKRVVNLDDHVDLKQHMIESHDFEDGDFHRNSHAHDHPALGPAGDDDRPLTHMEIRKLHDHDHEIGDYAGTTMGNSHFHTATRKTASGYSQAHCLVCGDDMKVNPKTHLPDGSPMPNDGWHHSDGMKRDHPAIPHDDRTADSQRSADQAQMDQARMHVRDGLEKGFKQVEMGHQVNEEVFGLKKCPTCRGGGWDPTPRVSRPCSTCDGEGHLPAKSASVRKTATHVEDPSVIWSKPSGQYPHRDVDEDYMSHRGVHGQDGPFFKTRHPETRAHQVVDRHNRLITSTQGSDGSNSEHYDNTGITSEVFHEINQAHGHHEPMDHKADLQGAHDRERAQPDPPFEHTREDPRIAEFKGRPKARVAEPTGKHSPHEEWHGPYEVVQHPETKKFHVVDNQGRNANAHWSMSDRDKAGHDEQWKAESQRDHVDRRTKGRDQAKQMANSLFDSTMDIMDPGGTEESRRSDRNISRMNELGHRYEGGTSHPLHPGKFGADDLHEKGDGEGEPFYEVKDPAGSGWKARDYGGARIHIHHEATGEEAHDAPTPSGGDHGSFTSPGSKRPGFDHEELHKELHAWVHGDPNPDPKYPDDIDPSTGRGHASGPDYARAHPKVERWQKRNGYKG